MHVAIRADGGPDIGYGHLVRTGALAQRLLDEGHRVTYATRQPETLADVCPAAVDRVSLDPQEDHRAFVEWLETTEPEVVITDSYEVDMTRQGDIADRTSRLAVILDDARYTIRADILINGNVYAPDLDYRWIGREPEWCVGTDFLLLREEIRSLVGEKTPIRGRTKRALISMGGSDIQGTTPAAIRAFDGCDLRVDVIVGPGFENRESIEAAASVTDVDVDVLENPPDLPRRMLDADVAVSATGSTVYELLALGTPTIGIPQVENQEPIAAALADLDAIETIDTSTTEDIAAALQMLLPRPDRRRRLRDRGFGLVDGRGVERVYEVVVEGGT